MTIPKINASPTKEFFISILVRDVLLNAAIADLVDNCIDGALRVAPDGDYSKLYVKLNFDGDSFSIEDNCGGISAETAIEYAFRFGRPADAPPTLGSVGQFGVGMKRSLFKIGNNFNILSISPESDFTLEIDVDDWRKKYDKDGKELWEFEFKTINQNVTHDPKDCGTTITVTKLNSGVAKEFATQNFKLRLVDDLKSKHQESLEKGLVIEVGEYTLSHDPATLLRSDELQPFHEKRTLETAGKAPVFTEVYAGVVKDSLPDDAGWYVSCNGRMILRADKTRTTGWDEEYDNGKIPKAHNQFARFRGFLRFTCDDADILPWNTTKNGLDTESNIYQAIKPDLKRAMRQVIDFLNKVDAEIDSEESLLTDTIGASTETRLSEIPVRSTFDYPTPRIKKAEKKEKQISYPMDIARIDRAKSLLQVTTLKEVGLGTFEYFMKMEEADDA